jgi:YVTN family beta-propeller protein
MLQISVVAPEPASFPGKLLQTLDIRVNRLAADPSRPRVYATVPGSNSVAVIDTVSLSIIKTISIGPEPVGLAISADGSRLWVANSGSTTGAIGVIDLNSLTALPSIPAPLLPSDVEEGLNNRLYVTPASNGGSLGGIMQIDASTGQHQGLLGGFEVYQGGFVEISPDRKTLYFGNQGLTGSTAERFDVSTGNATLIQDAGFMGGNGQDLKLSHDGQMLVYPNGAGNGTPSYTTFAIPSGNLRGLLGTFNIGAFPGPAAFSGDDLFLYHYVNYESKIDIFDTRTFLRTGTITVGPAGRYDARDIELDNRGERVFVATSSYPFAGDLRIFDSGRKNSSTQPPVPPRSLLNVSTRLRVQTQDDALIGGFIVQGNDPKKVVLRAIGPSIQVSGRLADPTLTLYNSAGNIVGSNDNWNATRQQVLDTQLAPADEHEPVVVASLPPGAYTMVVRGLNDTTGIGLVELYDIDPTHSRVANISTRGRVESGDNVMIGGFIIGSDQPTKVIVRAIGPSLGAHGVSNALPDPILKLHDGNGSLITENDSWRSLQEEAINNSGLPPNDDRESAIVATLQPGNYTAVVSGKDGASGVALVEIYNLDTN